MSDSQEVLAVLEAARDHVERAWAQGFSANWPPGYAANWPPGYACASTAILAASQNCGHGVAHAAHVALLRGAGIPLPDDETDGDAIYRTVYYFNDAQTSVAPVVAAFVKAITALRAELERPKQLPTASHSCLNPRRLPRRGGSPLLLDSFRGRPVTGSFEGMATCRTNQAGGPG